MDVGVSRAFFVARNAEEKAKAIETRFANQQRLVKAGSAPAEKSTASLLSFDQTLDAAGESALFGTPDEIAKKLEMLRAAGIEHMLLNGPTGSRENLRAFARDVMPAFTGRRRPRRRAAAAACEALVHKPVSGLTAGIPPLIKRNTLLLALSQSFIGAGTQLAYGIGPLMVHRGDRLGEPRRAHGRAVRREPLPGVLPDRQDHRHLWPQARHPVRAGAHDRRQRRHRARDAGAQLRPGSPPACCSSPWA